MNNIISSLKCFKDKVRYDDSWFNVKKYLLILLIRFMSVIGWL